MSDLKLIDRDGDELYIIEAADFLCYIEVNNTPFGVSILHAQNIIEKLTEYLNNNK